LDCRSEISLVARVTVQRTEDLGWHARVISAARHVTLNKPISDSSIEVLVAGTILIPKRKQRSTGEGVTEIGREVALKKQVPIGEQSLAKKVITARAGPFEIYRLADGSISREISRNSEGHLFDWHALSGVQCVRLGTPRTVTVVYRLVRFMDAAEPRCGIL
jgi:hypothetical protein